MPEPVLTAQEICSWLGISPTTVWRWKLPHVRVCGLRGFYQRGRGEFPAFALRSRPEACLNLKRFFTFTAFIPKSLFAPPSFLCEPEGHQANVCLIVCLSFQEIAAPIKPGQIWKKVK